MWILSINLIFLIVQFHLENDPKKQFLEKWNIFFIEYFLSNFQSAIVYYTLDELFVWCSTKIKCIYMYSFNIISHFF